MAPPRNARPPSRPTAADRSASAAARRLGGSGPRAAATPAAPGAGAGRVSGVRTALVLARRAVGGMLALVTAPLARGVDAVVGTRDPLTVAMIASLLLHGLVMLVHFTPPKPIRVNPNDARLEVVLLNAQTRTRPMTPEVLAQVNQEGGGEQERGRARSPLPAEAAARDGSVLQERQRRVEQLEAQQRQLMALAKGPQAYVSPERPDERAPRNSARDNEDAQAVMARMQAEIARNIEDYNKRPRRLTFGVNAVGVNYARYVADWAARIERIGTERYPPEARGRQYDSLIITAEIDKHGNVVDVVINKKSKYEALNRVVKQIVYAGQPYERFPPEMASEGDILQIVRTWTFTNDVLETSAIRSDR
jgi:protein TonB